MCQNKIAVFGSAFNPPHKGHADAIQQLLDQGYSKVLVVPSANHAFGKNMVNFDLRILMAKSLISEAFSNGSAFNAVEILDIESLIYEKRKRRGATRPIYTYELLRHLRRKYKNTTIHFAIGPDNARDETWNRFYKSKEILKEFGRVVLEEKEQYHSSDIRDCIKNNKNCWEKYVTNGVSSIIKSNKLYF